jgi:hypothetical protein
MIGRAAGLKLEFGNGSTMKSAKGHHYNTTQRYPSPAQPFHTPAKGFENKPVLTSLPVTAAAKLGFPAAAVLAIVGVLSPPVPVSKPRAEWLDSDDFDNWLWPGLLYVE